MGTYWYFLAKLAAKEPRDDRAKAFLVGLQGTQRKKFEQSEENEHRIR
jgi:hypothetical protein